MDWNNPYLRILNFTSYSMNGAIASLIVKTFYKRCDTYFVSYRKQEEMIQRFMDLRGKYDAIIFTNFAPTVKQDLFQKSKLPILILDHHENALPWLKYANPDYHVNPAYSGSMMAYKFFKRWESKINKFETLATLADDFELWKLHDRRSMHLNTLFFKSTSPYDFIKRWSNGGDFAINDKEKEILTEHVQSWKKYYEDLKQLELPNHGRFITSSEYHSEISQQMDRENVAYFLVYHPASHYITFRSRVKDIDVKWILNKMGITTASPDVGVIPCKDDNEAKRSCIKITQILTGDKSQWN